MNEKGFTLIELLVSVVILSITALSLMALFPQGFRQVSKAGKMSVIDHLGHQKIDQLKAKGFGSADLTAGQHPASATQYRIDTDPANADYPGYSITWFVNDNQPIDGVKTVVVEVGYVIYHLNGSQDNTNRFQIRQKFVTYIAQ